MARDASPIAADLFLVGSGLFSSPRVSAVSKQINAAPYRFSATDSCRCHLVSLRTNLIRIGSSLSIPCLSVSWPLESIHGRASHYFSFSNPLVSSTRPAFPQLRRSPPIPSLPWLLAADLFRGCSAQLEALPCHSVASRCAWIPVPSLLRRLTGGRFQAVPFRSFSRSRRSSPCHCISHLFCSFPLLLQWIQRQVISARVVSCGLAAIPQLFVSSPYHSTTIRIVSRPFAAFASPFGSLPCHCLSAHLRLRRSWPFPCSSHRFGSWLCRLISTGCDALPYQVISATVSAEPFLCFSILR